MLHVSPLPRTPEYLPLQSTFVIFLSVRLIRSSILLLRLSRSRIVRAARYWLVNFTRVKLENQYYRLIVSINVTCDASGKLTRLATQQYSFCA